MFRNVNDIIIKDTGIHLSVITDIISQKIQQNK